MKAEEKREQFRSELMALLKKYNVSIELQDFGRAYSTHEKMVAVFAFDSELEDTGIINDIVLGRYEDGQ